MKIESRKGTGRYKKHKSTQGFPDEARLTLTSYYVPAVGDKADAVGVFHIVFGMDGRRFVLNLSIEEARGLFAELKEAFEVPFLRRVK